MRHPLNKVNAIALAGFHLVALAALFNPSWHRLAVAVATWYFFGCVGVTLTYHRLLTHGGFKTYRVVEYTLATISCLALQGHPIKWVADHWKHHKHSDEPGLDPHTPQDGKWWAHVGWILFPDPTLHQDAEMKKYARYLYDRPFYQALRRVFWLPTTLWGLGCIYFGGFYGGLGWGLAIPIVFGLHFTWLINSGTHIWGTRRFDTDDNSRNSWWIALLTFGEGWHNNHHAKPVKARHGIVWYEFDPTWYTIKLLEALGLFWDVKA